MDVITIHARFVIDFGALEEFWVVSDLIQQSLSYFLRLCSSVDGDHLDLMKHVHCHMKEYTLSVSISQHLVLM